MSAPEDLPGLPRDADGPVFSEPWQAQAFALAVELSGRGAFSWSEWAEALGRELATDPDDDGSRYYDHWVAALERLSVRRNLSTPDEMAARKAAWAEAYRRTPHGKPIEL
ncbi:MAG TPA: nitrile hydratase accessory protein [Caulobacteraceae bacterium]|nr:nitrile hydratase accessory protein [Caulobacteraceae bacterium]